MDKHDEKTNIYRKKDKDTVVFKKSWQEVTP